MKSNTLLYLDPPYGLGKKKSFNENHADYLDDYTFDLDLLGRIDCEFVIWGGNYFEKLPLPRTEIGWVVWDKRPTRDTWTPDDGKREAADRIFGQHFEIAITNVPEIRGKIIRKTWGGFYGTAGYDIDKIVHKTQKPVDLHLACFQERHKVIIDYFLGSGSTLIACEKTNRTCRALEIDPHYVDVAVKRFADFTKQSDNIYLEREGEKIPYASLIDLNPIL